VILGEEHLTDTSGYETLDRVRRNAETLLGLVEDSMRNRLFAVVLVLAGGVLYGAAFP